MIIIKNLDEINKIEETVVALGNFDGIHKGHKHLINEAVKLAKNNNYKSAVFTFSNHPKELLPGNKSIKNILSSYEKIQRIESLGVDYLISIPFTEEIMNMSPTDFVNKLLIDKLNCKIAICGFNYNFGSKAKGNPELLRNISKLKKFEVKEMKPYTINDDIVSSTLIRTLISSGRVDKCKEYLGYNYHIRGIVVHGNHLGHKIGFPTSNLNIEYNMVTPPNGVYFTFVEYDGKKYPSVTNVGNKPTIGEYSKNVETHIFDFNKELYGKEIIVEFLQKSRDEVKFDNVRELSEQIIRDCKEARSFFKIDKD